MTIHALSGRPLNVHLRMADEAWLDKPLKDLFSGEGSGLGLARALAWRRAGALVIIIIDSSLARKQHRVCRWLPPQP